MGQRGAGEHIDSEAAEHPHIKARNTVVEEFGLPQPAPAPRFSRTPGSIQGPPAWPGQHTDELLADWGFAAADIERLRPALQQLATVTDILSRNRDNLARTVDNLAPFSQFQMVSYDPPTLMFSANLNSRGQRKDTVVNVEASGEFVWNMATWDLRERIDVNGSPIDKAGLTNGKLYGVTPDGVIVTVDAKTGKIISEETETAEHEAAEAAKKAAEANRPADLQLNLAAISVPMSEEYLIKVTSELTHNALKFSAAGTPVWP